MKKGFTLIELLAVILILGIIALIAVPQITNVIEKSRQEANLRNVETHIHNIENNLAIDMLNNKALKGTYSFNELGFSDYPKNDVVRCTSYVVEQSTLQEATSCLLNGINYCYINGKVSICGEGSNIVIPTYTDYYLLEFKDTSLLAEGDLDKTTGALMEATRMVRTQKFYEIYRESYVVDVTKDFILSIYEYDASKNYIGYVGFTNQGTYVPSENAKYFKMSLKRPDKRGYSLGQWNEYLANGTVVLRLYIGDVDSLSDRNKNITINVPHNVTKEQIMDDIFNNSDNIANDHWYALVSNGVYNPNISTSRRTYYVSGRGDDRNSGLTKDYPKKTIEQFSDKNGINILLESGYTYDVSKEFKVGSYVTIASYGEGTRPVLSFYRELNHTFTPVEGYENLYVTDVSDMSECRGDKTKKDCNLGQLLIDGEVDWKRYVFEESSGFSPTSLTKRNDEKAWTTDYQNAKLYIWTTGNPNNYHIKYAPAITGLTSKSKTYITVKGIEIVGAGLHAINFTDSSNVLISSNSFKYIGGSIGSASVRYGNAVQLWNSATNVEVSNNIARWIFDTCYTNQGSSSSMMLTNVTFKRNIGMYAQWGLETWGDGGKGFSNIDYSENILYHMSDITNPDVKMQVSSSGHPYGESADTDTISYRGGNRYQQIASLAFWCTSESYIPAIHDNIFWGTNRYLVIGKWYNDSVDISSLNNNLFYEDYHLYDAGKNKEVDPKVVASLYKISIPNPNDPSKGLNKYYTSISSITSSTTNTISTHKKLDNYDNTNEKARMLSLIGTIINK